MLLTKLSQINTIPVRFDVNGRAEVPEYGIDKRDDHQEAQH